MRPLRTVVLTALLGSVLAACSTAEQKGTGSDYTPQGGKTAMQKTEEEGAANPQASTAEGP